MIRLALLICIVSYSVGCNATSCIEDQQGTIERSKHYLKEIYIDVDKSDFSFYVSLSFPLQVEGADLTTLTLVRESDQARYDFVMPIDLKPEKERVIAWYLIGRDVSDSNIIEAIYGDPCGVPIRYTVNYEQESLEPVTIDIKAREALPE